MESITFRAAIENDTNDIYSAMQAMAVEQKEDHRFSLTREKLFEALFSPNAFAEVILARKEDKFAGLVLFSPTNRNFDLFEGPGLYIHEIYVPTEYRRKGIGSKLMATLQKIAEERKCCRIDWVKFKKNSIGAHFYRSIEGAQEVDYIDYMRIKV